MTRPRLIVLTVIGIALLLWVGNWVSSRTEWVEHTLQMPPKGEAARNPFYAAQRFADRLGADTSWDRIFTEPSTDAVIVLSTWQWSLSANRRIALERWVERGGRLVVDSALFGGVDRFEKWSGVAWKYSVTKDDQEESDASKADDSGADDAEVEDSEAEDSEAEGDAIGQHEKDPSTPACSPAVEERDGVPVSSNRAFNRLLCANRKFGTLETTKPALWGLRDERGLQAVRVRVGRGSVTVLNWTPFRQRQLFDGDHAWLLVAATEMTRGDEIHFLSQDDHPGLLAIAWMRGWPVIVLCGLFIALILWRGAMRFGPLEAAPALARRSLAEQIRGTGEFVVRGGGAPALHAAVVRAFEETVRKSVKGYAGLKGEARTSALTAVVGHRGRAEAIAAAMSDGTETEASDSRRTLAKIEAARRQLVGEDRKSSSRSSLGARR